MDYSNYTNKMNFPYKPAKPTSPKDPTPDNIRKWASDMENYEKEMVTLGKLMDEYQKESRRLEDKFMNDALADVGLSNHPKKTLIYSKAYEKGHSGGFSEIYYELSDLADLVRELES